MEQDPRGLPAHKVDRLWNSKLSERDERVRAGAADAHDDGPSKEGDL